MPLEARPVNMLVSMPTGVNADDSVDCDNALRVGTDSQEDIIGKTFAEVKLQCKNSQRP